jgi:hypothetical protein
LSSSHTLSFSFSSFLMFINHKYLLLHFSLFPPSFIDSIMCQLFFSLSSSLFNILLNTPQGLTTTNAYRIKVFFFFFFCINFNIYRYLLKSYRIG